MSKKSGFLVKSLYFILLSAPLMLAACHSDSGPFPMPSGYAHHAETYNAPDGPEIIWENWKDRTYHEMPARPEPVAAPAVPAVSPTAAIAPVQLHDWHHAAEDLVNKLKTEFGQPTEPVFVMPGVTPEEDAMKRALHAALVSHGFEQSPAPGLSPFVLDYDVLGSGITSEKRLLKLMLKSGDMVVSEVSGFYKFDMAPVAPAVVMEAPSEPEMMEESNADPISLVPPSRNP